jgi:hypothetical protein
MSRLVTTTILGAVFGVICMLATRYAAEIDFWPLGVAFLLHHTVLGFAIGASSLKMNWAAHGTLWGVLFGVFLGIVCLDIYPDPWQLFVMPIIWGFLIETLATKAFKQPQ